VLTVYLREHLSRRSNSFPECRRHGIDALVDVGDGTDVERLLDRALVIAAPTKADIPYGDHRQIV
jgi:hypothetical protein